MTQLKSKTGPCSACANAGSGSRAVGFSETAEASKSGSGRALIAMSGGVDSSVAALLMRMDGWDCVGITMKLFQNEDVGQVFERACCSLEDAEHARRVAASLGMPFYVFDFTEDFRKQVMDRFAAAYLKGDTPNPCIDCNRFIKYERLFRRMQAMDADCIVTGHYAQVEQDAKTGRFLLKTSVDAEKDQSYVLYAMTQAQLSHTRFPLGGMTKPEVRRLAEAHGFSNAHKADSQDICFVRDGDYAAFIESYRDSPGPQGNFVDQAGNALGRHEGIIRYTIGQRKGLGRAFGRPMYVLDIRPETGDVVLGPNDALFSASLTARDINLISVAELAEPMRVRAKIRYSHKAAAATVCQTDADTLRIIFDEPQRAITRGQAVVLYDGDIVVGGGTIETAG
jgi:tRNA-specific 2-thiouridylase